MPATRFHVLVSPRGYMTCLAADSPLLADRYSRWQELITVNRPLTDSLRREAQEWALWVMRHAC